MRSPLTGSRMVKLCAVACWMALIVAGGIPTSVEVSARSAYSWAVRDPMNVRIFDGTHPRFQVAVREMINDFNAPRGVRVFLANGWDADSTRVYIRHRRKENAPYLGWAEAVGRRHCTVWRGSRIKYTHRCDRGRHRPYAAWININDAFVSRDWDRNQRRWLLEHEMAHVMGLVHRPGCSPSVVNEDGLGCVPPTLSLTGFDVRLLEGLYR